MPTRTEHFLTDVLRSSKATITEFSKQLDPQLLVSEKGKVLSVDAGIARISGLPSLRAEELVRFNSGVVGIAADLDTDSAGVILLGDETTISAGMPVVATGRVADAPIGDALLGRVINPVGRPLDKLGNLAVAGYRPVEQNAPGIMERAPVSRPMQTGIKAVDTMIPVGRGQRQLILGDRQTGKTSVAIDTILNQKGQDVLCIYCAIGQRGTATARVIEALADAGALDYTIVVSASGHDTPGLQYIAPYAATSMAEYFRDQGRDVLIVYDDLTRHARVYRELSLLLRHPPGREAYPGDIFYIHSRLLERSTQLSDTRGGGSLTALPIVETQSQDMASYIPTNLISITDGQIYLSPELFNKNQLPAIDVSRSVSRVGGASQYPALRELSGPLRLAYSQFEELQSFARFATRLDTDSRDTLERGTQLQHALKQVEHNPVCNAAQVATLKSATEGLFDGLEESQTMKLISLIEANMMVELPAISQRIESGEALDSSQWQQILHFTTTLAQTFR